MLVFMLSNIEIKIKKLYFLGLKEKQYYGYSVEPATTNYYLKTLSLLSMHSKLVGNCPTQGMLTSGRKTCHQRSVIHPETPVLEARRALG